ncbi:nuclear transport factor 2 family protein [Amycolatopsis sp. NPDC051371]|uniref:nuclear transport factor 2 family protein n=1 Tax=Amycolatopsis sp. NPDC051371 TaxID=3155800 RepID=UPI00343801B2
MREDALIASQEELLARLQIKAAMDSYALGLDTRDLNRFLSAWHEDAIWDVDHPPATCDGHNQITEFAEASWQEIKVLNHFTMNHVVEISGDQGSGVGHAAAMMVSADDLYITAAAVFHDKYERRSGTWKISHRKVTLNHWAEHPEAVVKVSFGQAQA